MAQKYSEWCPSRHLKPVIGSCSICKKTVCAECKAPIASEHGSNKIICKFCYDDLNAIQEKINASYEKKIEENVGFFEKISTWLTGPREKMCENNLHLGPNVIGNCVACRKTVCEICVKKDVKISSGAMICQKCYASLYDVQGELEKERRSKFFGAIREFFLKIGRFIRRSAVLISVIAFLAVAGFFMSVAIFYQIHPEAFEVAKYDWQAGYYKYVMLHDVPDVIGELKDRVVYSWKNSGNPHADFDAELRQEWVGEYRRYYKDPPGEDMSLRDIKLYIRTAQQEMLKNSEGNPQK